MNRMINDDHLSRTFSRHVRLDKYSKVSKPLLSISRQPTSKLVIAHLRMMYFLCTTGIPFSRSERLSRLNTSSMVSNLSAYSEQSPPIYLQNLSGVMSEGIWRLRPGGGKIGRTTCIFILGVLNLKPDSVLPVKVRNAV